MSKKKGLSLEEKRRIILDIYHTTKAVYNLKDLERDATKRGVVQQSVKDVNQSLIDDGLVDSDKIGAGNFYWSFPSKALQQMKNSVEANERAVESLKAELESLQKRKAELSKGREMTETRKRKLSQLEELRELHAKNEKELQVFKDNDPEELEKAEALVKQCKLAINRWTDNGFAIKNFLVKKKGMCAKEVDKWMQSQGGWDDNYDYVE